MSDYFNIGEHVFVISSGKGSRYKDTIRKVGIVERGGSSSVGVRFNGLTNSSSGLGLFWYKSYELKLTNDSLSLSEEREDDNMNVNLIESGAKSVVGVKFLDTYKQYSFLCHYDVEVGNTVVVDSNNEFQLALVQEIITIEDAISKNMQVAKEVMCVCDFSEYNKRKEIRDKKAELKKQMDKRIKELQTSQIYELFAEKDDTLKELLEQYKEI